MNEMGTKIIKKTIPNKILELIHPKISEILNQTQVIPVKHRSDITDRSETRIAIRTNIFILKTKNNTKNPMAITKTASSFFSRFIN